MNYRVKIKGSNEIDKYLNLAREQNKDMEHEVNYDTKYKLVTLKLSTKLWEEEGGTGNQSKNENRLDYTRVLVDLLSLRLRDKIPIKTISKIYKK